MSRGSITRDAVLKTLAEHDAIGRAAFLEKYHFKEARDYVLLHEGREYDSKAIAGVAHKFTQGAPLTPGDFSGGRDHAVAWLKREGFTVRLIRNPDWVREEVILACDLVMRNGWRGLDSGRQEVVDLSALLQTLPCHDASVRTPTFRNANGVARKTFDISTQHPDNAGKKQTNGGAIDKAVLAEFRERPEQMSAAAQRIREAAAAGAFDGLPPADNDELDDYSAPEGRLLLRRHLTRERSRALRTKKIDSALRKQPRISCEVCDFDFEQVYGERGIRYIECHHVVPLHAAGEGLTKLSDLALICSNCHRMIHRTAPWPTPPELRELVQQRASCAGS
ncbi:HNH endonuclease [Streptomyces sp. NPDC005248]|uniref:HNH endonuclease n=1 Tax=Streptomyces sp. NPDC005248 TaxID=3364709 RepID=UPI0036BD3705